MKRLLVLVAIAGLVAPARAQLFGGPMTPNSPAITLGAGLPAALANPPDSSGGVTLLNGSATPGDCLVWGANGIQDAGSPCMTPPTIGAMSLTGTGAPDATSLANRATDSGVTFNLKNDFGAACNGSTDDTTAIQNWLAKVASGVHLVAPAGTCNFSTPLKVAYADGWSLAGSGHGGTNFSYTGLDYNGTVTAGASWSAAAPTITLSSSSIPANVTAALTAGDTVSVWDTQGVGSSVTSPQYLGTIQSIAGTTLTLAAGAIAASQGSSDSLHLTTDLITVSDTNTSHGWMENVVIEGFTISSTTNLSGGSAFHAHALAGAVVRDVVVGTFPVVPALTNMSGGFWFDGAAGIYADHLAGDGNGTGDGVLVNGALGGNADLMLHGPAFSWFANGLHMAGTFGGLQCDGAGDIRTNGTDLLIDNAVTAAANFDYEKNGGCAFDGGYSGSNIVINDTKTGGGMPIVLNGWLGASWYASTVDIEKCPGCLIYLSGALASLSCQDGVYIQDQSVYLSINAATQLRGNGQNGGTHSGQPLGNGTCTTGTGRGWGVYSTNAFSNFYGNVTPISNAAGSFKNIAGYATFGPPFEASAGNGAVVTGSGTTSDVLLQNGIGQVAMSVPTGTKTIKLNQSPTVSTLPTCNAAAAGGLAVVSDATSTTFGAAPVGGGADIDLVFCNGSSWLIH